MTTSVILPLEPSFQRLHLVDGEPVALEIRDAWWLSHYDGSESSRSAGVDLVRSLRRKLGQLAHSQYRLGRYRSALLLLRTAAALGRRNSWLFDFIGLLERDLGEDRRAIAAFRQALALDPANDRARKRLAYLVAVAGDVDEALEMLRILVARGAASPTTIHDIVARLTWRGLPPEEALDWYRLVVKNDPGNRWAHLAEAQCLRAVGELQQAVSIYERLAEEREDQEIAVLGHIGRSATLAIQGDHAAARAAADELVARFASDDLPADLRQEIAELEEWLEDRARDAEERTEHG